MNATHAGSNSPSGSARPSTCARTNSARGGVALLEPVGVDEFQRRIGGAGEDRALEGDVVVELHGRIVTARRGAGNACRKSAAEIPHNRA
jgi:hypothetical protein